jgi:hypothetical protein
VTRLYAINGTERTVKPVMVRKRVQEAYEALGLSEVGVDHGRVYTDPFTGSRVAIVVHEFSLFAPPEQQKYFSIMGRLYGGNAVIYAEDRDGQFITVPEPPPGMFYRSHIEVEAAIKRREVHRPETRINGELVWSWPAGKRNGNV